MGAKFLRVGAPCRGERVAKLNRLLQIENELDNSGKLAVWPAHAFPMLIPPSPPPEEGAESTAGDGGAPSEDGRKGSAGSKKK